MLHFLLFLFQFSTTFKVEYRFEEIQNFQFAVYDIDDKQHVDNIDKQELIGTLECTLAEIMAAGEHLTKSLRLNGALRFTFCVCICVCICVCVCMYVCVCMCAYVWLAYLHCIYACLKRYCSWTTCYDCFSLLGAVLSLCPHHYNCIRVWHYSCGGVARCLYVCDKSSLYYCQFFKGIGMELVIWAVRGRADHVGGKGAELTMWVVRGQSWSYGW